MRMSAFTLQRPPVEFVEVPLDADGQPLNVTRSADDYSLYLDWIADSLYRPSAAMPASALLSLEAAWSCVSRIETEIAPWIWEHPFEDYPPDSHQPQHADILHRVQLSHILSRVPAHDDRRELLDRFYRELEIDSHK